MPNYLHKAGGTLSGGFPWSIGMISTASVNEAAAQTAWDNAMVAMWGVTGWLALVPSTVELTSTSTSTADAAFRQTTITRNTHAIVGTGGAGLPYQVAEVVTWRTAQATKWGRGRWYLPPMTAASLAAGGFVLAAASVTEIVAAVNAAISAWIGTLNMQIRHPRGTLSGPGANTLTPITGGDVANKCVIQRRRADKLVPTRTALTY
jgi:hypothetical protein